MTTGGTLLAEYAGNPSGAPWEITNGPNGNLWYTDPSAISSVTKLTTGGALTSYRTNTTSGPDSPAGVAAGPDGNVWFTADFGRLGKVVPSTGAVSEWQISPVCSCFGSHIAVGGDGYLYFIDRATGKIAKFKP